MQFFKSDSFLFGASVILDSMKAYEQIMAFFWSGNWFGWHWMPCYCGYIISPHLSFLTCENDIWDELVDPRNLLWWFSDVGCFPWVLSSPGLDPLPIKKTTASCGQSLAWESEVWVLHLAVWPCSRHPQLPHSSSEQSHGNQMTHRAF